jgi:shikimate dehydrogenase
VLGASVTVPHKEAVMAYLDAIDPLAEAVGAVNLIVHQEGKLTGYNTDAGGFLRGLVEEGDCNPRNRAVVVLGAGGAARAICFILVWTGISSLTIVNRTVERAQTLVGDLQKAPSLSELTQRGLGISWDNYGETVARLMSVAGEGKVASFSVLPPAEELLMRVLSDSHLVVNCTSVGMKHTATEGRSPLPGRLTSGGSTEPVAYDLVYNPLETRFLQDARRAGAKVVTGLPMLIYQGVAAFQMWTGRKAPVEVMMAAGRRVLGVE